MQEVSSQQARLKELPEEVSLSLIRSDSFDLYTRVLKKVGVDDPDVSIIAVELKRYLKGNQDENQLLQQMVSEYGISEDSAKSVLITAFQEIIVPFKDVISVDLNKAIQFFGGTVFEKEGFLSPNTAYVQKYLLTLESTDAKINQRLEHILLQYLENFNDRAKTKELLMHSLKLGGLGLSEETAEKILRAFDQGVDENRLREKEDALVDTTIQELEPSSVTVKNSVEERPAPSVKFDADFSKVEEEAQKIAEGKKTILETKGPLDIPQIVKEICENPTFQFEDSDLQTRCEKLVESRVRDVRDASGTRAQLERSVDKGGLGVSGRRLADILQSLEGYVQTYQDQLAKDSLREQAQKREQGLTKEEEKEAFEKKEEQILSKRYAVLTGKMPGERVMPVAPSLSRTSAALSAHHEQQGREGKIDSEKVRSVVQEAKKAGETPRSSVSQPSMQEVVFTKRLSGPLDELQMLSLTDFRRLSQDPQQAATKIRDKVDLMEEQGYDKKVEAIAAWRSSPMNQQYVELAREAVISGASVAELLRKRREGGAEVLTDEELKAVMKLNADLRF